MFLYQASITDTFVNISGLAQNTTYFWRVRARNAGGLSCWSSPWNFTSLLSLPVHVTLISPNAGATFIADRTTLLWHSAQFAVNSYWLKVGTDSLLNTLIVNDSTIADTSAAVDSLVVQQSYWWEVKAKNAKGWGAVSTRRKFSVIEQQSSQTIVTSHHALWNMISNPLFMGNDSVQSLFRTSLFSYAFTYVIRTGYAQRSILEPGQGYWLKYPAIATDTLTGIPMTVDSIVVSSGWNMVGSISDPVDTSQIISIPQGIILSQFFDYQLGYVAAQTIEPGKAYWIKVNEPGILILQSGTATKVKKAVKKSYER
jgi:hypothetical protein